MAPEDEGSLLSPETIEKLKYFTAILFFVCLSLYITIIVLQTDDVDFVLPENFFVLGVNDISLPLASGKLSLPGLRLQVPLGLFFLLAPLALLLIHFVLLDLWSARTAARQRLGRLLAAAVLVVPMVGLAAVARQYFPFSAVRPATLQAESYLNSYWLTIVHAGLVVFDVLLVLYMTARAGPGRAPLRCFFRSDAREPPGPAVLGICVLGCLLALGSLPLLSDLLSDREGMETEQPDVFFVHWLVLTLGLLVVVFSGLQRLVWRSVASACLLLRALPGFGRAGDGLRHRSDRLKGTLGEAPPMRLKIVLVLFLCLAMVELAEPRGLDLEGQTLAVGLPEEIPHAAMVLAYARTDGPTSAWEKASEHAWAHATGLDFRGWRLNAANLRSATMPNISFVGSQLVGANLQAANLFRADLSDAQLPRSDLRYAQLRGAKLVNAGLCGARLQGAALDVQKIASTGAEQAGGPSAETIDGKPVTRTNFSEARLRGAFFSERIETYADGVCDLNGARSAPPFPNVILKKAVLTGAHMNGFRFRDDDDQDVDLDDASMALAELTGSNFQDFDFTKIKTLRGAKLRCAVLNKAIIPLRILTAYEGLSASTLFTDSELEGVEFVSGIGARPDKKDEVDCTAYSNRVAFPSASFKNAKLKGAVLAGFSFAGNGEAGPPGVDLSGADFAGADLFASSFAGRNLTDLVSLEGADLRCADLSGANLSGKNLQSADLRGADLSGADLTNANLIGAPLRGTKLRGADLTNADVDRAALVEAIMGALEAPKDD